VSTCNNANNNNNNNKPDLPVGRGPVAYPLAPYGHFKLVSLCRLEHDVPSVKA